EILAPAVEDDAGHVDGLRVRRPLLHVEVQRREAMLAVDDQKLGVRLRQVPDAVAIGAKLELLVGVEQHRARNGRLGDRSLVEVRELAHLGTGNAALERVVGALDARDELGDVVVLRNPARRDLLALAVKAADEAHLGEQVLRPVADEIKNPVLLTDLGRVHGRWGPNIPGKSAFRRETGGSSPGRPAAGAPAEPLNWGGSARQRPLRNGPDWRSAGGATRPFRRPAGPP